MKINSQIVVEAVHTRRKSVIITLLLLLPVLLSVLIQPTTRVIAQDDPHAGQPATCNNYKDNTHPCMCNMATTCPDYDDQGKQLPRVEDSKCQVYCRHEACQCISPCDD